MQHYQTSDVTHIGPGLVFRGSATPPPQGAGVLALLNFFGFYSINICHRTTKFGVVTHVGERRLSWDHPRLPCQKIGVTALLVFRVLLFYAYIL